MKWSDVVPVLAQIAPTIATVVGTPLLGGAVTALEDAFGLLPSPTASMDDRQSVVAQAITNATPEQLAAVRKADQDYAARMAEAGFKDKEALAQLALTETQTYVGDTADARRENSTNNRVYWLGVIVLATFALVMTLAMWASWSLLTGAFKVQDAALVGMVAGFIGSILGYVAGNAGQVISFFFGSSRGSDTKSEQLATAFTQALAQPVVAAPIGTITNSSVTVTP